MPKRIHLVAGVLSPLLIATFFTLPLASTGAHE